MSEEPIFLGGRADYDVKDERFPKAPCVTTGKVIAALVLATGLTACHFNIHIYHETIVNDTGGTVIARHCDNYCDSAILTLTLAPGQGAEIHVQGGVATWFSLTDPSGGHVGCLNLGDRPNEGARFLVSAAGPCP